MQMDMQEPVGMCRCQAQQVRFLQDGNRRRERICIDKTAYHLLFTL
jgi:hypothetical protein